MNKQKNKHFCEHVVVRGEGPDLANACYEELAKLGNALEVRNVKTNVRNLLYIGRKYSRNV